MSNKNTLPDDTIPIILLVIVVCALSLLYLDLILDGKMKSQKGKTCKFLHHTGENSQIRLHHDSAPLVPRNISGFSSGTSTCVDKKGVKVRGYYRTQLVIGKWCHVNEV